MRCLAIALWIAGSAGQVSEEQVSELRAELRALQGRVSALEGRLATVEAENIQLRGQASVAASEVNIDARGAITGRKLTEVECCRWTPDNTCGAVAESRLYKCSMLHEYLEGKPLNYEFADVGNCLGDDEASWSWKFDGATGDISLSGDTPCTQPPCGASGVATQATFPTPFKVTVASDCSDTPPTLTLRMDTVTSGALEVGGMEVADTLTVTAEGRNSSLAARPLWVALALKRRLTYPCPCQALSARARRTFGPG